MVKNNCIILSALCCAVIFYGRFLPLKAAKPYRSLLPLNSVSSLDGSVASNPTKLSSGRFYAVDFAVNTVAGTVGSSSVKAAAYGSVPVYIPTSIVESLYPGRLYTQGILVEKGERMEFFGSWNEKKKLFIVEKATYKQYSYSFWGSLCHFRALCRLSFKRFLFPWGKAGGLLLALFSGTREYTSAEDSDAFRKAGLSHILALSGMHLSFFAAMTERAGNTFWGRSRRTWTRLGGICVFVWFAGFSPSLLRAFLFCLVLTMLELFHCKEIDGLAVLAAVFLLHLLIKASDMFSISFMLSYAAMAGILCFSPSCQRFLVRFFPPAIAASLSAAIAAQVATAPLSLMLFGCLMPAGIIASVIVSPLAGIFLAAGAGGILLCLLLPFLAPPTAFVLNGIYSLCLFFVHAFAKIPAFILKDKEFL